MSHRRSMMLCRLGWTMPSRGLWEGSPFQQASISCQHSSSNVDNRSGREPESSKRTQRLPRVLSAASTRSWRSLPFLTLVHSWSLLEHLSKASGSLTEPEQRYQKRIPNAYTSTELSYFPAQNKPTHVQSETNVNNSYIFIT